MAVIAHVVLAGVTPEQYDAVRAECGWLQNAPEGGIAHLSWWEGSDNHNLDAWESEADFNAFGEQRLGPAIAKLGIQSMPEVTFHPAHEVFTPKAIVQPLGDGLPLATPGDGIGEDENDFGHPSWKS